MPALPFLKGKPMEPLIDRRFRANPDYELVSREMLAPCDDDRPQTPLRDESLYGYLRPKGPSRLVLREVSPDAALLFLALQHEGRVPDYFRSLFGPNMENRLIRLILDGILEVEHEGEFVSGLRASELLPGKETCPARGRIATLSIEALRYVEALGALSNPEMTRRLYDFGRRPATPAQKRAFHQGVTDPVAGALSTARPALDRYWVPARSMDSYWIRWRPIGVSNYGEPTRFKLYISAALSDVADAIQAATEILGQSPGVSGLKLGRGFAGLTRPDKLIAYFSRLDDLQEAGWRLHRRLHGCEAQGVPFTAELSSDGLLSWGADPPRAVPGQPGSWRLWLACKLATHFETARMANVSSPIWRSVLDRLRADGVDPQTWIPASNIWSSPDIAA